MGLLRSLQITSNNCRLEEEELVFFLTLNQSSESPGTDKIDIDSGSSRD